jgi:hypothetical protein
MPKFERGLYEALITEALDVHLQDLGERLQALRTSLRPAEAADRIALHLSRIVQRALSAVGDEERVGVSIALARSLIRQIDATIDSTGSEADSPIEPGSVLRSVAARQPADYVSHESELPMAITWRLRHPLPGDLFASFAAAVA